MTTPVLSIDDLSAQGAELPEEQLLAVYGGLRAASCTQYCGCPDTDYVC